MAQKGALDRAYANFNHGDYQDVLVHATRAESYKTHDPELRAEILFLKALALEKLNRGEESQGIFRYLVKQLPGTAYGHQAMERLKNVTLNPSEWVLNYGNFQRHSSLSNKLGYPVPATWSFPEIIESARQISPNNIEGKAFNQYGVVYSNSDLQQLSVSTMTAEQLQKYADIVTHAYPDAVLQDVPATSEEVNIDGYNEASFANYAYVSLHALNPETRAKAARFLHDFQQRWSERKRPK